MKKNQPPARDRPVRKDKAQALTAFRSHPLFPKLKAEHPSMTPLERARIEFDICQGKKIRALADALEKDPGTIRDDLKLLRLGKEEQVQIEQGRSVSSVLKAAGDKKAEQSRQDRTDELAAEIMQVGGPTRSWCRHD